MPPATAVEKEISRARDVRVDRVGYAQELVRLWADPIRASVKTKMKEQELDVVEGDRYEGKIAAATTSSIDAAKFFRQFKAGKIKEADFISAIRVSREAAAAFMPPRDLEAITEREPGEPRFTISRKKGIDLPLAAVIAGINEAVKETAAA